MWQKQRAPGAISFDSQDQEVAMPKPLSFSVPDVHESMRLAGVKDLELEVAEAATKEGSAPKRRRLLCCCGQRECGLGPMTQIEEGDF